jgi:hypothetical protein
MRKVGQLRRFRQECEHQSGKASHEIELPLLHMLADICAALKLSNRQRRRILGRKGIQQLDDFREWRVHLRK